MLRFQSRGLTTQKCSLRGKVVKEQNASRPNEASAPPPPLRTLISFTKVWENANMVSY